MEIGSMDLCLCAESWRLFLVVISSWHLLILRLARVRLLHWSSVEREGGRKGRREGRREGENRQ